MDEKLLAELAQIKSGLETKTAQEVKSAIDAFETKLSASNKTQFEAELKTATEAIEAKFTTNLKLVQDHADKLDVKLQEKQSETKNEDSLVKSIKDNFEGIANVRKGNALQVKTVGNMTLSNV